MLIKIIEGQLQGKQFEFHSPCEIAIGRDESCELTLNDDVKISRKHAILIMQYDKIMIEDLDSTNGVFVNDQPVFKKTLKENDQILIGDTLFKISDISEYSSNEEYSHADEELEQGSIIVSSLSHKEADLLTGQLASSDIDDLAAENRVLRKIGEISQIFARKDTPQNILISILDNIQEILSADIACILSLDQLEKWKIRATTSQIKNIDDITISMTIVTQALNEGTAILSSDTLSDNRFDPSLSIVTSGVTSAMCSPFKIGDEFRGILFFDRRNKNKMFTSMELRLTATVGNLLGVFLEKEKLEIEAKQKERLAVIGEVIAGLAHYTKNIITGLKFSIDALKVILEKKKTEAIPKCLRSISTQEKRISDLVLNMLTYSKERIPVYSEVDLNQLIFELIEPYKLHFEEEKISFKTKFSDSKILLLAEETSIHRVFLNLLVNALDSLKLKLSKSEKIITVHVSKDLDTGHAIIKFRDYGMGISKEQLKKIFNVFFSTKGSEGTGLGLAVVCKIIDEHKGHISADSVEGEWTEFKISLPMAN